MNLPSSNMLPDPQNSQSPEWRMPLSELSFMEDEVESVVQVLRSGWWTRGPQVNALEREYESRFGIRHAIAVSNCIGNSWAAIPDGLPLYAGLAHEQVELVCKTFLEGVSGGEENG